MADQITFYTHVSSPFSRRVAIAFNEAGVSPTSYYIDLQNKPEWYTKVNPIGKIPAITYGAPVPPDQPSSDSFKLAESSVIVEFIADLYPSSGLLPKDIIGRAKARFFVNVVDTKLLPGWLALFAGGKPDDFFKAFEFTQSLIPDNATYAAGDDFTIADIAIAPLLPLLELGLKNDCGKYAKGEGPKLLEQAKSSKYDKLWGYMDRVRLRKSFQEGYDEKIAEQMIIKAYGRKD